MLYQEGFEGVPAVYIDFIPDYSHNRFILFADISKPVVENEERVDAAVAGLQCQA